MITHIYSAGCVLGRDKGRRKWISLKQQCFGMYARRLTRGMWRAWRHDVIETYSYRLCAAGSCEGVGEWG